MPRADRSSGAGHRTQSGVTWKNLYHPSTNNQFRGCSLSIWSALVCRLKLAPWGVGIKFHQNTKQLSGNFIVWWFHYFAVFTLPWALIVPQSIKSVMELSIRVEFQLDHLFFFTLSTGADFSGILWNYLRDANTKAVFMTAPNVYRECNK